MARMTPDEWRKKKQEESQGTSASPVPYSAPNTNTELSSTSSGRMSPIEWKAKKSTSSLQAWTSYAKSLLNETQNYFNTWRKYDDTDEEYAAIRSHRSDILAQADSWRKMYAGNDEAIAHIDSVVSALAESSDFAMKGFDYYSKWDTVEDYQKALRESDYLQKYNGLTYKEIQSTLGQMEDGEEKTWLTDYGKAVDYNEKLNFDLDRSFHEIDELERFYDKAFAVESWYNSYRMNPDAWEEDAVREQMAIYNELKSKYGSVANLKQLIEDKKQYEEDAARIQLYYPLGSVNDPTSKYYDPDFEKYAEQGAAIKNPSVEDAEGGVDLFGYRVGAKKVGNIVTYSRDNYEYIMGGEINGYDMIGSTRYLQMTDDEVDTYNYHLAKNGEAAAKSYLYFLDLGGRQEQMRLENLRSFTQEHPFIASGLSVVSSLGSGAEYLADSFRYLTGMDEEMDTNSMAMRSNVIRGTVSEMVDWEIMGFDAFDFVYNTTMSGVDSVTAAAFGNYGGIVLGLSAAAQGTNDALSRGMSSGQAFWNGFFNGVFEGVFETFSIGKFNSMKEVSPDGVKAIMKNLGKSMLVNASEETLTEIANIAYDTLINGEFANYTWDELKNGAWKQALGQVIEAGASGALMGLGMGAVGNTAGYFSGKSATAEALYGDNQRALVDESLGIDPNNRFAQRMQSKLDSGADLKGRQLNKLIRKNEKTLKKQDVQSIQSATESRLTELGETGDVTSIAAALTKQAIGKNLSRSEQQIIAESKYGQRVANELNTENIQSGDYASAWAENIGTERINVQEYNRLLQAAQMPQETAETTGDQVVTETQNEAHTVQDNAPEATIRENQTVDSIEATDQESLQVAEDGVTRQVSTNQAITPQKIVSLDGGKVMIQTDQGTIAADDIFFGTNEADLLWRGATSINGINTSGANGIIRAYQSGTPVATYLGGAAQEFKNGYYGMESGGKYADKLTPGQRNIIYDLGQKAAGESIAKAQAALKDGSAAKSSGESKNGSGKAKKSGNVHFDRNGRTFDAKRETALKTMDQLSKALGVDFYVYESYVNEAGQRVYKDVNGNEKHAPNGWYDPSDGSIHIDLNAGMDGNGTMLFTIAHELTHFIRQWSPAKFKVMANVLIKMYGKQGVSVKRLVNEQIRKANKQGRTINYDTAFEEVVADSMEAIMADGNVMQFMVELKQQDKSLWQKICDWFKNLASDLKAIVDAYKGVKPDSVEGKLVADMQDMIVVLESLYADALADAGQNYQATQAQKNTTQEGDEAKYSQRYFAAETNSEILSLVNKVANGEFKANEKVYLGTISDKIADQIYSLTGIQVNGFKIAIEARQIDHILKGHGMNGDTDHSMADPDDIARIEYALNSPDDIRKAGKTQAYLYMRDGKNRHSETVLYEKSIGAKSYYVIQAVPDTKAKTLYIVTAFIGKSGYKKEASQLINAKSLDVTAKTEAMSASNDNVAQGALVVKEKFSDRDSNYMDAVNRGDMEAAQRMVDEAADDAGFTTKGYHGSRTPGFTVVDKYSWLWAARDEAVANGYGTHDEVDSIGKPFNNKGVYAMRYNLGNNLQIYADGASWGELPVTEDEYPGVYVDEYNGYITTNAMAEWAERNGYDSITFVDVDDGGLTTVDVIFNPNRDAKSADPITYDDDGGVIPLSKRFNQANDDIRYSDRDSDGNELSKEQQEYFKNSKVRDDQGRLLAMYHGTPNGGFTKFRSGTYFTQNAEYADVYQNPGASSISTKKGAETPMTYKVYLDIKKPFDTRKAKERNIFQQEFYRKYGTGTPLADSGLPDWVDGMDLQEFIEEMEYDYDGLILDEGGTGGFGDEVKSRGLSYVVFSSEQVKDVDNKTPTSDPDIHYSERNKAADQTDIYTRVLDLQHEVANLQRSVREMEQSAEFKTVHDKLSEAVKNDNVEEGIKLYQEWRERSGYAALVDKMDALRVELESLTTERDNLIATEGAEAEKAVIAKSGLSEADYFRKQAVKEFGYTPYFYDAGYITPNGKMLNFSGEKGKHFGSRGQDHRAIGIIYENTHGSDAMVRFMNDGNIRIMAETPGLDISSAVEPTNEQYAQIKKFARESAGNRFFAVDISDENGRVIGNYEYDGYVNADRVVNDIKYYFKNGEVREQSAIASFLQSERDPELEKVNRVLQKENAELKHDVAYLKELLKLQRQVTGGTKFTKTSVEAAARQLMKYADARGDTKELVGLLNGVYEYIAGSKELTWDGVKEAAEPAVAWLQSNVRNRTERSTYAQDVLQEIRGSRIYLDEQQKKEVEYRYGSYNEFRKKTMGSVILTDKATMSLDSQWHEWSGQYPNLFAPDTTSTDMPAALMDVFDSLRNMNETDAYGYDRELFGQELLSQVYDSYWNVSTLYTVKDKAQKEINKLKFDHAGRMATLKKYHKEQTAKLKAEHKEDLQRVRQEMRDREEAKLKKIQEHYHESRKKMTENRQKAEMRRKIRKTVMDLNKLLSHGDKKRNVKEEMKGFVSKALELADYLFTDHISNDDLIRRGITVRMTAKEAVLVKDTEEILSRLYDHADSLTDEEFMRLDSKRKRNMEKLRDILTAQRNDRLQTPVYNLFSDLVTEYAGFKNAKQESVKAAYDPKVEAFLRSYIGEVDGETDSNRKSALQNMRVADMTLEDLWKLHNAYTMVLHSVREANKFFVKGMTETIEQLVDGIASDFKSRKIPKGKVAVVARNLINKIGWNYEKLYYALDRIGSEKFTKLIMNLANSENIVMQDVQEAVAFRDQIVKKYGFNNWDINKKIDKEFLDNAGKKFTMTLGQMMSLYAYSRREGAWDHIEYGGFVFGEKELTNPKPADSYKLSKKQCEAITDALTKEQKAYVEDMQKFLSETMGAKGNEVSMRLYGIEMFHEKNYFPIHIAGQFKAQAQESQAKAAAGFGSMSNAGFTHAQNPNAKAPFVLEGFNEVWSDHVNEMSRYHGTVPALEDIRRVMNRSYYSDSASDSMSIKQVMENSFGKEAVDYFDNLYREANSGAITDKMQGASKKLLSKFRKNSVAYSLSVLIQQPASLVRAYAVIDKKYFGFKGFGALPAGVAKAVTSKWTHAYNDAYAEMLKYAPGVTLAKEIGGFDTASGNSIRSYLMDTGKGFAQKMKTETVSGKGQAVLDLVDNNPVANLPNVADKIAWIEIWNACKRETLANNTKLSPKSDEFMQKVGQRFTEVIQATQVYDSIFAKSPMLKSKNLAVQYLVSFMNEPNTVANMVESGARALSNGDVKKAAKMVTVVVRSIVFTGVLKSIIYALRDDDEDETFIEKYLAALTGSLIDDSTVFNYIPIARDVWSLAQGYDVERPDMAIVSDAISSLTNVFTNYGKDTSDMTEEELIEWDKKTTEANWKLVDSIAAGFGIPVKNIRREINAVIDHARIAHENSGKTTWSGIEYAVEEAIADASPAFAKPDTKSSSDKLYHAIISGDTVYANRLKDGYKDEDSYHNAIRKALRENDPRIKEAARAQIDGDPSERVRIAKLIIADGFSQDDVVAAINSQISKMTPSDGTTEPKKKGLYTVKDFAIEISNGDTVSAKSARSDYIETAKQNGKTQEEAEESFMSSAKSELGTLYIAGKISKDKLTRALQTYSDMEEDDIYWKLDEWNYTKKNGSSDGYDKYNEFFTTVQTGKNLSSVIQRYTDHGVSASTLSSQISEHFKPMYIGKSTSQKANIKGYILNAYEQLGYDREKGEEKITDWEFEENHCYAYSDRAKLYKDGDLSTDELRSILMDHGGMTYAEACYQIEAYDWEAEGYKDVTMASVRDYNEHCSAYYVPKDTYLYIKSFANKTENDKDANGKTIYYSAMRKVMAEINAQYDLSPAQKTAVARSLGWADKNIWKYKLW